MTATILIVDDEEVVLKNLTLTLTHPKRHILTAENGTMALECLRQQNGKIDLMILDIMMPDMSGLEVLKTMKSIAQFIHIPVILYTGLPEGRDAMEAMAIGAVAVLPKLGTLKDKKNAIETILARYSAPISQ